MKELDYQLSVIDYELQEAKLSNRGYLDVERIEVRQKTKQLEVKQHRDFLAALKARADEMQNLEDTHKKFILREKGRYKVVTAQIDDRLKECRAELKKAEDDIRMMETVEFQKSVRTPDLASSNHSERLF